LGDLVFRRDRDRNRKNQERHAHKRMGNGGLGNTEGDHERKKK
jgi:hypothetical protein